MCCGVTEVPSRPGQPFIVQQTGSSVTLNWDPSTSDGGSAVLNYVIERREMRGACWVRLQKSAVTSPPYTMSDLRPSSCYQFRVYACNVVGVSEPSQMSKVIASTSNTGNQPHARPRTGKNSLQCWVASCSITYVNSRSRVRVSAGHRWASHLHLCASVTKRLIWYRLSGWEVNRHIT